MRCAEEMLVGYRFAKAESQEQLHTDDTSRRQITMMSLVIRILEDNNYVNLTASDNYIAKKHAADGIFMAVEDMLDRLSMWVERLKYHVEEHFPTCEHDIPDGDEINMAKFISGRVTVNNCNAARKLGEQLVEKIEEAAAECQRAPMLANDVEMKIEVEPCQHYQRNICLDGASNEMSKHLKNTLVANNVVLKGGLRVHMDIPSLNHAAHKYFSLTCDYLKGKGNQFKSCMEKNHPGVLLVYVMNGKGSRQDVCVNAAPCFCMNYPCWVEFLDKLICYGDSDNKLECSLWVALTSAECVAVTRGMSIVKFTISDQL